MESLYGIPTRSPLPGVRTFGSEPSLAVPATDLDLGPGGLYGGGLDMMIPGIFVWEKCGKSPFSMGKLWKITIFNGENYGKSPFLFILHGKKDVDLYHF